jgi:hypothetical protein
MTRSSQAFVRLTRDKLRVTLLKWLKQVGTEPITLEAPKHFDRARIMATREFLPRAILLFPPAGSYSLVKMKAVIPDAGKGTRLNLPM